MHPLLNRQLHRLARPIQVVPGVFQIQALGAKVTLIEDGRGGGVLIDAGGRGSLRLIESGLSDLRIPLQELKLVVLTHNHPDHAGGLSDLIGVTNAAVGMHIADSQMVSGASAPESPFRNNVISRLATPVTNRLASKPVKVEFEFEGGERLPHATDFEVIHTPGHTPGHICLYSRDRRLLITGDALQFRGGILSPPAASVTRDPGLAIASLQSLLALDFDVICFSHFPALKREAAESLREMLARRATEPA